MIELNKLVGIVIWYYPTLKNVGNINSYIENVHKLIIIDNSDCDNSLLLSDLDNSKILYIANKENKGVDVALNQGCRIGIESGAEWVLTMDQDSFFIKNDFATYIQYVNEYEDFDKAAIFAAVHFDSRGNGIKQVLEKKYSRLNYTMTSGNLLSLKYLQKLGFFLEDLFIDWVDEEICIRIRKSELQIVQINSIFMEPFVGNGAVKTSFFGKTKYFYDYAPIRFYYITRNILILCKLHPHEKKRLKKRWLTLFRKTVFYDNVYKLQKIKYTLKGILDYSKKVTGPINRK